MSKKIKIELMYDGWSIYNLENGKHYHWDHTNENMGTTSIKKLLEDIGYKVELEEVA